MTAAAARKLRIFWSIGGGGCIFSLKIGGGSAARLTPVGVGVGTRRPK